MRGRLQVRSRTPARMAQGRDWGRERLFMSFSRIGPYGPMGRDTMKNWGLPLGGLALLGLVLQILLGSDPAEKPLGHPLAKVITATEPGSSPPAPPHRHRAPRDGP